MNISDNRRLRVLKDGKGDGGPVVYWMSRDQRVRDNWALLAAQTHALGLKRPLSVLFCMVPDFLNASMRQYGFMMGGLQELEKELAGKNISFHLLTGDPAKEVARFVKALGPAAVFSDFDPLRIKRRWKAAVAERITVPFLEVDAHNIVPCWTASPKQEYGAYTIRPKLKRLLPEFLADFPRLKRHPFPPSERGRMVDWKLVRKGIGADTSVGEVTWAVPGERAALKALRTFVQKRIARYPKLRNDPSADGQSGLSPYLHFGQLSAQRVALEVMKSEAPKEAEEAFLEELIVRRELSDNFCLYNPDYDGFRGFPQWARLTLDRHRRDKREYVYSVERFEHADTHDPLWNAAQSEMTERGKMHGYMRMYWAKKILEWSASPEQAMETAIYLNDRYELDGRDPNGYAGIAWSIGGVHDRAWNERPVFGKVRYMSYNGCRSKFDVKAYIEYVKGI